MKTLNELLELPDSKLVNEYRSNHNPDAFAVLYERHPNICIVMSLGKPTRCLKTILWTILCKNRLLR